MIALFEEAYRVSINDANIAGGSRVGLLLGLLTDDRQNLAGILLLEDGFVTKLPAGTWSIDFRYDAESDRWLDQGVQEGDQEPGQG
jgi:hypothetical protein